MMLESLGRSVSERSAYLKSIEERVLTGQGGEHQHRISRYLDAAKQMLNQPLRVAIVGEVNAGKTELANLILGIQVLPTSVVNNTLCSTIIRYGEFPHVLHHLDRTRFEEKDASDLHRVIQKSGFLVECRLPLPLLKSVEIIDFPAFENVELFSGSLGPLLVRSDLVIWCSSTSRAWTATEMVAWRQLPGRLKRSCLFALTHADRLSPDALADVMARVRSELASSGVDPIAIATTSAIEARSPRGQIMNGKLWNASGGERFFKNLVDLLQTAINRNQQRIDQGTTEFINGLNAPPESGTGDGLSAEWVKLAKYFERDTKSGSGAPDAAAAARAIIRFKRSVCEPWLRSINRPDAEIESFLRLLPETAEDLMPKSDFDNLRRMPLIFHQLSAELEEYTGQLDQKDGYK